MPPGPVPTTAADITQGWLQQALQHRHPALRLRGWQAERIGQATGFASEVFRLTLDTDGGPRSVIAKLWAASDEAGLREARFFQAWGQPGLPHVVRCDWAQADARRGRGALLLQDLHHAEQGDCLLPISTARACMLAQALATLQAAWQQRQQADPQPTDWLPAAPARRDAGWLAARRLRFEARFEGALRGPAAALLAQLAPRMALAQARLQGARRALLHRDLHLDNVLFSPPDGHPVILDWAQASLGPAALDVAVLCYELQAPADAPQVARHYLHSAREMGLPVPDEPVFQDELAACLLVRWCSATCGVVEWTASHPRAEAILAAGLRRAQAVAEVWQALDPALFGP